MWLIWFHCPGLHAIQPHVSEVAQHTISETSTPQSAWDFQFDFFEASCAAVETLNAFHLEKCEFAEAEDFTGGGAGLANGLLDVGG